MVTRTGLERTVRTYLVRTGKAELCSLVFLGATAGVVSLPKRTLAKKLVNLLALTGILVNRVKGGGSLVSVSFAATAAVWAFAASKLVKD